MNFLAHLYLSGENEQIRLGNFIGDFVKGRYFSEYPDDVQRGILLHRFIDTYTDKHHIVIHAKKRLQAKYGHYSGVVIDMFYDHFLAVQWDTYSKQTLRAFVKNVHYMLRENFDILPKKVKHFLPIMIASRRLESYSTIKGIENALRIMSRYTTLPAQTPYAIDVLKLNYSDLENEFNDFFYDITEYIGSVHKIKGIGE